MKSLIFATTIHRGFPGTPRPPLDSPAGPAGCMRTSAVPGACHYYHNKHYYYVFMIIIITITNCFDTIIIIIINIIAIIIIIIIIIISIAIMVGVIVISVVICVALLLQLLSVISSPVYRVGVNLPVVARNSLLDADLFASTSSSVPKVMRALGFPSGIIR